MRLLLEIEPGLTIAKYKPYAAVFAPPGFAGFLVGGLRQAGLPEA